MFLSIISEGESHIDLLCEIFQAFISEMTDKKIQTFHNALIFLDAPVATFTFPQSVQTVRRELTCLTSSTVSGLTTNKSNCALKTTLQAHRVVYILLRRSGHVEVVCADIRDGPLWSQTHRQPLRKTRQEAVI